MSTRFVVTMENGRELVVYAPDKESACALIAQKREAGETVGPLKPIPIKELGGIVSVVETPQEQARLIADARKAPGS